MYTAVGRRVPWPVMRWLHAHWPLAFQLLYFGKANGNTAEHWDEAWTRHGRDGYRATGEMWPIRERLLADVPAGARVLDVGCGVGEVLALLRERLGCEGYGVDIAPAAVARTRALGFTAEVAKLPAIPFADGSFDAVVCTETLEHVSDADGTLRAVRRVLRPGGRALVSVPDGANDEEEVHVHRFSRRALERALGAHFAAVRVEEVRFDGGTTFYAVATR